MIKLTIFDIQIVMENTNNQIEIPADPGIYAIVHKETGKRYVGSSDNIRRRLRKHKRDLERGVHDNSYLQKAWNKYGPNEFRAEIIELCPVSELLIQEQQHIDSKGDFNLCPVAGCVRGIKHSKESRKLESHASKIRWENPDYRTKKSEAVSEQMKNPEMLARTILNPEVQEKRIKNRWTDEHRKKNGIKMKEKFANDAAYKEKIVTALRSCQEERVNRLRERFKDEEFKKKTIAGMQSEAGRKRHAEIMASPEMRAKRREAALEQWRRRRECQQ